jgi:hypothetical protein
MPQDPYSELGTALRGASPWSLAVSALGCIHRASSVLFAAGVVSRDVMPFSEDSLVRLGQSRDVGLILEIVVSRQQVLAVYSADPETGELSEETDRAELLALASETVLRANRNTDFESLLEWADFCCSLTGDIAQHLDSLQLSTVDRFNEDSPGEYNDIAPLPARDLSTQLEIIQLADRTDGEALSRISDLSTSMRIALLPIALEAMGGAS